MARINVDDDFWVDPRFRALARLLQDEDRAIGMCLRAWRTAQRYWGDKKLIPAKIWNAEGLSPLVEVDLAEEREDGVYCRGAERHFEWYSEAVALGRKGGLKSAETRRTKYGSAQPGSNPIPEAPLRSASPKAFEANFNPPDTDTALVTDRGSKEPSSIPGGSAKPRPRKPPTDGSKLWDAYRDAYGSRYHGEPTRNATVNGQLAHLVKRLGLDEAAAVVRFFFACEEEWLVGRAHPLGILVKDAESWRTKMVGRKDFFATWVPPEERT